MEASLPDGFTWTGDLNETDIRALYAACHSLRFSGRLQLKDGAQHAEVLFVAGEPVEIDGGDTQRISLWTRGSFRAVQGIPNLTGELTTQREVTGSLAQTKPSSLWAWISEYRLTCEIDLERPGSKAVVMFSHGHAESAQVNGQPELAALARVSSWTDGTFRVRLRPLFVDGVIPMVPPMPEGQPPLDPRQFDVSRSIPMDLRGKNNHSPTPPLGELAMKQSEAAAQHRASPATPVPRSGQREERTALTQPLPPPRVRRAESEAVPLLTPKGGGKTLWILTVLALLIAAGLGALYYFHLPPFSPPPKPIVETPVEPKPTEPVEAKPTEPVEAKPTEPVEAKPTEPVEVKPTEPVEPVEAKPSELVKDPKAKEKADKLIAKGRMLLVEGHEHTALEMFKKAEKLLPKDAALRIYEQQALGKLGRAEILVEGKGSLTIDGHKFVAPRKLKVPAGPHTVDSGDGPVEITLKRGEKKKLKAKPPRPSPSPDGARKGEK